MNPHQALIEAAEMLLEEHCCDYGAVDYKGTETSCPTCIKVRAAISSAKAAEEGVETKVQHEKVKSFHEGLNDGLEAGSLIAEGRASQHHKKSSAYATAVAIAASIRSRKTDATVISVREKEGSHGQ